jgi:glycosyltransferase involved in cell wall biosynthesis
VPETTPDLPVSVVMPAYQEEALLASAVRSVVDGLRAASADFDVVVVENGSRDRTWEVAQQLAAELPEVRVLQHPEPDYGRALRAGFLAATRDVVVNFDVDYFDLGFLQRAVAKVAEGADVVVGAKRGAGASDQRSLPRRLVTAVFTTILRVGFGLHVADTHGMKAMRRASLTPLVAACRFGTDLFDTELVLRAERAGLVVTAIGVVVEEQRPSRTPIVKRIPRTLAGLVRLRLALWRER